MDMVDEKELVTKLVQGNEQSFREIYDFYVRKVYRFVYSYVRERSEAEDITQNVFMRIWERRFLLDAEKSFAGLIFTISHRAVMDYFRRQSAKSLLDMQHTCDVDIPSSATPADWVYARQLESLYEKALQSLPAKRKEIFLLSRHNGLTNKQIAERLGISVKTVENQMTAALSSLKTSLLGSELAVIAVSFLFFLS
jgi:RNA polymerase sigma-70 factor (ECF subfamily)